MQNIPKIVRDRLHQETALDPHPDADLLTAFAEQALAGREREGVLNHLARCGDCREIVALALPATEAAVTTAPRATRINWMTWPVLRWGVVTAGILAVASAGILEYNHRKPEKMLVATRVESREQSSFPLPQQAPSSGALVLPSASVPQAAAHTREATAEKLALARGQKDKKQPAGNGTNIGGPISHDNAVFPGVLRGANAFHGSVAGGRTFGKEVGSGADGLVSGQDVAVEAQSTTIETAKTASAPLDSDRLEVARAKAPPKEAVAFDLAPSPPLHTDPNLIRGAVAPRWAISASGGLQRSLDGGETWANISVNSSPVPAATAMHVVSEQGFSGYGSISGFVADPSGAVIPGAAVILSNLSTAGKRTESTGNDGRFRFADLLPGRYQIEVEKRGFRTLTESAIVVNAQQNQTFDARLQNGEASTAVAVTASAPALQTETSLVGNAEPATKGQAKQERPDKKDEAKAQKNWLASPSPVFHALAASGPEVWAGGSGAALYHSLDAGAHWTRVLPSASGIVLTGDITAVEFSDLQHGRITTSTSEVWTTADDGQSWSKQR